MSTVFEGVLCATCIENALSIIQQISSNYKLETEKVSNHLSAIYRLETDRNRVFSSEIEYIASQISLILFQAILIRYNDRIGYRMSVVYQEGNPIKSFGLEDEIWVMTDEDGEPIVNGKQFNIEQIKDDNEEYETIYNAIQLGLDFLKINTYNEVHSFITRPY